MLPSALQICFIINVVESCVCQTYQFNAVSQPFANVFRSRTHLGLRLLRTTGSCLSFIGEPKTKNLTKGRTTSCAIKIQLIFFTLSRWWDVFPSPAKRFFEATMRDETKPVRCGCGGKAEWVPDYYGGHVTCKKCGTQSAWRMSKEKAVKLWNEAMGAFGRGEYWEDDDEYE